MATALAYLLLALAGQPSEAQREADTETARAQLAATVERCFDGLLERSPLRASQLGDRTAHLTCYEIGRSPPHPSAPAAPG